MCYDGLEEAITKTERGRPKAAPRSRHRIEEADKREPATALSRGTEGKGMEEMNALGFVAHTPPEGDPKKWQSMTAHTGTVADLAARFASAFGAEEPAMWAVWLHDVGKYSNDSQQYLR